MNPYGTYERYIFYGTRYTVAISVQELEQSRRGKRLTSATDDKILSNRQGQIDEQAESLNDIVSSGDVTGQQMCEADSRHNTLVIQKKKVKDSTSYHLGQHNNGKTYGLRSVPFYYSGNRWGGE